MSDAAKLTHTAGLILKMIAEGVRYGFDIMEATGLPSGTVYPALRRLEQTGLIASTWEKEKKALAERRPPRKYYRPTPAGKAALKLTMQRYPLLKQLGVPPDQSKKDRSEKKDTPVRER